MKFLSIDYNAQGGAHALLPIGDDALLRPIEGSDLELYLPEFDPPTHWSATVEWAFKVCKLGKGVTTDFASRYVDEMALAFRFRASDIESDLLEAGLSTSPALTFDGAVALSPFVPIEKRFWEEPMPRIEWHLSHADGVSVHSAVSWRYLSRSAVNSVNLLVEECARFHRIKVGDVLLSGHPTRIPLAGAGDRLRSVASPLQLEVSLF